MEAKLIELRGNFDLERERIAASGRVESSYVQATERQDSNVRDNKAKLIKEDKKDDVPQIDIKANLESRVAPQTAEGKPLDINIEDFNFAKEPTPEEQQMQQPQMGGQEQENTEETMQEGGVEEPGQQQAPMNDREAKLAELFKQV